jgi:hypothetical protein
MKSSTLCTRSCCSPSVLSGDTIRGCTVGMVQPWVQLDTMRFIHSFPSERNRSFHPPNVPNPCLRRVCELGPTNSGWNNGRGLSNNHPSMITIETKVWRDYKCCILTRQECFWFSKGAILQSIDLTRSHRVAS